MGRLKELQFLDVDDSRAGQARAMHAAYQDQLRRAIEEQAEVAQRAERVRGDTPEGYALMDELSRISERTLELQRAVADARRDAEGFTARAAMGRSHLESVRALALSIRDDREDMRQRGWLLPALPEDLREIVETGDPMARTRISDNTGGVSET
ncbi:hypothetical protein OHB41_26000 [Streptomyces sp. NBC_01571]|uniref:hypothetical protein n=1 Tax=Streptomyces sp. NBC_01571 TaxID=2975883 RepID=UPI0022598F75|nr:hypothetical protein [Streptomyces sp. NBC_01571]MCX4576565.1 hypothetical protein [Streptomyces sp. NBC_01571]